jgi:hypothetical protein
MNVYLQSQMPGESPAQGTPHERAVRVVRAKMKELEANVRAVAAPTIAEPAAMEN